jgi:hypothetical protein
MNQSINQQSSVATMKPKTWKTAVRGRKHVTEVTFSFVYLHKCHTLVAIKPTCTRCGAKWQSDSMLNRTCCIAKRHDVKQRHQAGKEEIYNSWNSYRTYRAGINNNETDNTGWPT